MTEWCQEQPVPLQGPYTKDKWVRCPKCKKRFIKRIRECMDPGCFHQYLPAHKKKKTKKKKCSRQKGKYQQLVANAPRKRG